MMINQVASAVKEFNRKPEYGIHELIAQKKCDGTPEDMARLLRETEGLDMKKIGEHIAKCAEFNRVVLKAYCDTFDFRNLYIDEAMHKSGHGLPLPPSHGGGGGVRHIQVGT